jgi:hypothetical protein
MTNAARNDEELAWMHRHRAAIRFGATDAKQTAEDKKHLILLFMAVPGELPLHFATLMY